MHAGIQGGRTGGPDTHLLENHKGDMFMDPPGKSQSYIQPAYGVSLAHEIGGRLCNWV